MPLLPTKTNLRFSNSDFSDDMEYFLASKIQGEYLRHGFNERSDNFMLELERGTKSKVHYKSYPGRKSFGLRPDFRKLRRESVVDAIGRRKSASNFIDTPILFSELCNLLVLCCGLKENGKFLKKPVSENHWPKRALPSGGGLFPLEYYVLARNVKGLKKGLYHFTVSKGALTLLRDDKDIDNSRYFWQQKEHFGEPSAMIFMTAKFGRTREKYGNRALRYVLLEAGGVGCVMNVVSAAMGLDFSWDGGGFENRIEKLIGLDGRREGLVGICLVGNTARSF